MFINYITRCANLLLKLIYQSLCLRPKLWQVGQIVDQISESRQKHAAIRMSDYYVILR